MFHYRWEMSDMRVMRARGKFKPIYRQLEVVVDALWAIKAFVTIWHSIQQDFSYTSENYSKHTALTGWRQQSVLQLLRGTTKPIKQTQSWILQENWTKSYAVHGENLVSKSAHETRNHKTQVFM